MTENNSEERHLIRIEEMSLDEIQLAEQLYNSAGLDPVVDAGLKDYDERIQREDKLISKVLGPRASDIRGYGESVAKRVAFAIYTLLNKQYGGKVGDLRSYIMTLQEERDRASTRYDELMGRVVGILGEEYKELRTDSKEFMEKLTTTLGEDLKESKIDQKALAERLADIDGLRSQIKTLNKEKEQLKTSYESQITRLKDEHDKELGALRAEHEAKTKELESEKTALTSELEQLRENHAQLTAAHDTLTQDYERLRTAIAKFAGEIPYDEIAKRLGEELYAFLLKDSKVPHMVIDGVGKFIDFRKYLGMAAEKGAREATAHAEETLRQTPNE